MMVRGYLVILSIVFVALQGCVAVQSYPVAARAGDTITLAVGSQDNLNKNNITLHYYSTGAGSYIDLTSNIRSVFKIYPDKASRAWYYDSPGLVASAGHGPWQNVIAVDLPANLTQGAGYFDIILGADVIEPNNSIIHTVTGVQISIEVLPPSTSPVTNTFNHFRTAFNGEFTGSLLSLSPARRIVLRNTVLQNYSGQQVAAAEYVIKLPLNAASLSNWDLSGASVIVYLDDRPQNALSQTQINWKREADILTLNVISPVGGYMARSGRFEILLLTEESVNLIDVNESLQLVSHAYYDLSGDAITTNATPEVLIMN